MTVLLFERRFWKPIATGDKVHTIRRQRKRPISPGDAISLRGWEGKAYRSKQCIISEEICIKVRDCWIDVQGVVIDGHRFSEPEELERFAISDGFESWAQMRTYNDFFRNLPFSGELIQWGVHPMLADL